MPLPALDLFHIDVLRLHDCASTDHLHAAVTRLSESLGYPYFVYALREAGRFAQSPVQLALAAGVEVHVVPGEACNLKITTADDWRMARHLAHLLA